jgi:hypothetical protein
MARNLNGLRKVMSVPQRPFETPQAGGMEFKPWLVEHFIAGLRALKSGIALSDRSPLD